MFKFFEYFNSYINIIIVIFFFIFERKRNLEKSRIRRYFSVTRRQPCLYFFTTKSWKNVRRKCVMNPMSELSYQAIRTANQAREAVMSILITNFTKGKI